jgi:hypothetical protein
MPRYEIVAHVTRELPCESAEEAAALVRHQLLEKTNEGNDLLHLAVWRQDPPPAVSPLPSTLRQKLGDFFVALERCAGEAEEEFRGRVEAILATSPEVGGKERIEGRAR